MKFRMRHADRIVGVFTLLAFVLLVGVLILMGANQRWFSKNYTYFAQFPTAGSVQPGTAILHKGFQVGTIRRVSLNEGGSVDAEFSIQDSYNHLMRTHSLLELVTSPIGLGSQLLLHAGRSPEPLPEESFVPTADSTEGQALIELELVDIPPKDDTITRLLSNVNPLLESTSKTVTTLNRTLTELNRALAGQSEGPLGAIISDASAAVARLPPTLDGINEMVVEARGSAVALLDSANAIADNIETMSAAFADPTGLVPKLLDPKGSIATFLDDKNALYNRVMTMLAEAERSVRSLREISASLSAEMPKLAVVLEEGKTALVSAQDVLEGLKNNPLLKGGITEREEQDSLYSSMREGAFE